MRTKILVILIVFIVQSFSFGQSATENNQTQRPPFHINGVFPNLTVLGPLEFRSESGIGALLPWADKLWMIGYVAHIQGSRIGLYEIDEDMTMQKHPESITGTFANRMVHDPSNQGIIGPHFISMDGEVRTCEVLSKHRLAATMTHLIDPDNMVYFLTMEGLFFECNVHSLKVKQLFNLVKELELPENSKEHFKGGFTGNGRVIVANNTYDEREYLGVHQAGRLAEWDGKSDKWTILDKNPYVEVSGKIGGRQFGKSVFGDPIFATGWDNKSVILKGFNDRSGVWKTYRLPKGSHSFDHAWNTEWMRIREAQTERFIMDIHGIFYELPMITYEGEVWGIKPISYHLRIIPDFCFWRGMLVMAGDQTDHGVGQPQSGLLFQNIDDLWNYGKPTGWGGVWREENLEKGAISDPFLMTGFDKKIVHFMHKSKNEAVFEVQVDILGNASWVTYDTFNVDPEGYAFHIFPEGFSAHWVRVISKEKAEKATVYFVYN